VFDAAPLTLLQGATPAAFCNAARADCGNRAYRFSLGRVAPTAVFDVQGITEATRSANMFELTTIMLK